MLDFMSVIGKQWRNCLSIKKSRYENHRNYCFYDLAEPHDDFGLLQVLIATSTLAWGVNFPAHLVVVKGTEYFDGKTRRYVDFPITGDLC